MNADELIARLQVGTDLLKSSAGDAAACMQSIEVDAMIDSIEYHTKEIKQI